MIRSASRSTCRWTAILAAVTVCLLLTQCAYAATTLKLSYVPNEYIIHAQAGASVALVEQAIDKMGATLVRALPFDDTYLVRMGRSGAVAASSRKFRGFTQTAQWVIESVQPNYLYHYCAIPNDEHWDDQWGMRSINMPGAWDIEKGDSSIVVAVHDSGVGNHPDLIKRLTAGYDFIDDDTDPSNDLVGHGTHCAGIVAAQGNNAIGVTGVCWDGVKIMPLKIGDTNGLPDDAILRGLQFAKDNGANVVSMSWGSYVDDPLLHAKLTELSNAGLVLCSAAGNDATDWPSYPCGYPEVISVSAIGPYDAISSYSNYGKVEIAAPGGDMILGPDAGIMSTMVTFDGQGKATYSYVEWEGTSMACPHVAGAAGILMSYGVAAADVRNRLISGARPPKSGSMDATKYGAGILDVQASLANAVLRINKPGRGATVGTSPDFRISVQGVSLQTVKIYLDYADMNDDGVPDNPSEGIIMDGTMVNYHMNSNRTAIEFNWTDVSSSATMTAGAHNIYVSGDAAAGGASVADWAVFNVARKKISKGIHLFAFPYALTNRTVDNPSKILPGTVYGLGYSNKSSLVRWMATPKSSADSNSIGYGTYTPSVAGDRVWNNPFAVMSGLNVPTGGGYYYDSVTREQQFAFPAGSGFWLILPNDVWVDESYPTLESLSNMDGSKGFEIPLYKGWNMIGNPYAHAVPWRAALFTYRGQTKTLLDAESAGWVRSTIYGYSSTGSTGYVRVTDRDMLESYSGYWVMGLVGGATQADSLILNILP